MIFACLLFLLPCGCQLRSLNFLNAMPGPETTASTAPRPVDSAPGAPSLFGDRPESENVPYENRLVSNLTQHSFSTEGRDFDPDIDATGKWLTFASTRNSESPDVFLKRVDGTAITQLTNDPADDVQPRFSPDGRRITFASNRAGNWDIWLMSLDGSELKQLTNDPGDEIAPCWSPDGTQIAFTAWSPRMQRWGLWTLSLEQPGVRQFLAYGMFPAWSPDGRFIAFQRARQRGSHWFSVWTIEIVNGEARHPTELAHSGTAACVAPRWSPDGAMLVYCTVQPDPAANWFVEKNRVADSDVWVLDLASGLRLKLTDGSRAAFNPTWSTTGRVYFVADALGAEAENIWSVSTGTAFTNGSDGFAGNVSGAAATVDAGSN